MQRAVKQLRHVRVSVHVHKGMDSYLIRDLAFGIAGILYNVSSASTISEIVPDLDS